MLQAVDQIHRILAMVNLPVVTEGHIAQIYGSRIQS